MVQRDSFEKACSGSPSACLAEYSRHAQILSKAPWTVHAERVGQLKITHIILAHSDRHHRQVTLVSVHPCVMLCFCRGAEEIYSANALGPQTGEMRRLLC